MAKTTKTTKKGKATKSMKSAKSAKVEKHTRTTQAGRGGVQDDPRLPEVGKIMTATYKGREIKVERVSDGFSYKKKVYRSLSKAAQVATKQPSVNGFLFFGLTGKKAAVKKVKKTKKAARRVKAD